MISLYELDELAVEEIQRTIFLIYWMNKRNYSIHINLVKDHQTIKTWSIFTHINIALLIN